MAEDIYDKPIDKNTKWDGDSSTNGLPVRGTRIEEFLKNSLNSKAGIFHYDTTSNRYLVFSDTENRDLYLNDTSRVDLVLGAFDAPFNYTAEININTPSYTAVEYGRKGNYIEYTFDIKNKSGASTGEGVNVTYTFNRNGTQRIVKETRRFGENARLNIDDYLLTGTNVITISIAGQNSLAATSVAVTYQVVNLSLTDDMDITKVYDITQGDITIAIPYTLSGQGTKMVEFYVDGEPITSNISEDETTDSTVSKIKYITLSNLTVGIHSIQLRAYTVVGGEKFYTDTLYREIIVNDEDSSDIVIAVKAVIPKQQGIMPADNFTLYGVEQFLPYNLKFATSKSDEVAVKFGESESELTLLSTIETVQGELADYTIIPSVFGENLIVLATADIRRIINVVISETTLNIKDITEALEFSFNANGRSNASTDKDVWNGNGYSAIFEGFKWNNQSGWVDNALLIGEGASVSFDYSPLSNDATSTGKTIELEFTTRNVDNEDAIICDLRDSNGAGILLTASEARLTSRVGSAVYTKFKSGERNRISFVINRNSNVVNKGMVFIYVNGVLSGAANYGSADKYLSNTALSLRGTSEAQIAIYSVITYNVALSSSQILNNYTLYQTTIEDMRSIYDRNEIIEDGSISIEKARRRLPVMLVTGDLLDLDEKSDTDYYITADIDYYNDSDPTKNFKVENARIRIQGTSSRFYPRKNYRFYTNKADYTVLYDSNGAIVADGLYAFKENSQPVDCWCLKADFAESSGTHNTGVARIWNEVMVNANFSHTNNAGVEVCGYPLRTQAQIAAKGAGFTKDVRTTIDGFPILLFRRENIGSDIVFVGKYNFNNDKSTPSVFGFEGIPSFDDSKVQSWETLENEDPIALFKTVDGFFDDAVDAEGKKAKRWELAFEARHTGSSASIIDLYNFCSWVVSKNGKNEEFSTEKWGHMDVYKVAAYYVYLMRFGALDQVVKNCFLTSEDGVHFYFINYDNDTILGVDNTGEISALPDVNRQSRYTNGSYVYAGHESVLWNMLEADSEFMAIVRVVDNALYSAGLTYKAVLDMFNNKQSGQWVERVYNEDAQYKYVAPYADKGINYLSSLQGSRKSHRTWWLSKRFSLYDSIYGSGDFTAKAIEIKCVPGTPAGMNIDIVSGVDMNYGYGLNRVPRELGVFIARGETHRFTVDSELGIGTPVAIYAAPYIHSLDIRSFAPYINTFNISNVSDAALGSRLKKLTMGTAGVENINVNDISGLPSATRLQELDIRGFKGITSLDLSSQTELISLDATGSGLASVTFANGAPITTLKLPASMLALNLEQLPKLSISGLSFEEIGNITSMTIKRCPELSKNISFVTSWLDAAGDNVSLYMDNIEWEDVNYEDLIRIGNIKNVTLKGYARLAESSQESIDALNEVFGPSVFDKDSVFYIDAPNSIFIVCPDEIIEGDSAQFSTIVFPSTLEGKLNYTITGSRTGVIVDLENGVITTQEIGASDTTFTIRATFIPYEDAAAIFTTKSFVVKRKEYPLISAFTLSGPSVMYSTEETYIVTKRTNDNEGEVRIEWELNGDIVNFVRIKSSTQQQCVLEVFTPATTLTSGLLAISVYKSTIGTLIGTKMLSLSVFDDTIAEVDAGVCNTLYNAGLCANASYITKEEARLISVEQIGSLFRSNASIKSFNGFKYFTGVIEISRQMFLNSRLESIEIPNSVKVISDGAFQNNIYLKSVVIPNSVTIIGNSAFYACRELINIKIPENIVQIGNQAFRDCYKLEGDIVFPTTLTSLGEYVFQNTIINSVTFLSDDVIIGASAFVVCKKLTSISLPRYLTEIPRSMLYQCESLSSIEIPDTVTAISNTAFQGCKSLLHVTIGSNVDNIASKSFSGCVKLNTITYNRKNAPSTLAYDAFGDSSDSYAGRETYNTGKNTLFVPVDAVGYEEGNWLNYLCNSEKCGFTLSKTL